MSIGIFFVILFFMKDLGVAVGRRKRSGVFYWLINFDYRLVFVKWSLVLEGEKRSR